ncbi:MAG: hypothetical protein EOP09_15130 [Proteobacteria bacterium]|nr:MAG: hypothetical protein EOP09_15130 [Pseudomonadota bacterium]
MNQATENETDIEDDVANFEESADEALQIPEAFSVRDENSANWVVRKIAQARARVDRMKGLKRSAGVEIKQADAEVKFFKERFGPELEAFAREMLFGSKKKSFKLLEGTLVFRTRPEKFSVTDHEAAVAWAKEFCPEAVQKVPTVTEVLDEALLESYFRNTGDVPFGCLYEVAKEVFDVK